MHERVLAVERVLMGLESIFYKWLMGDGGGMEMPESSQDGVWCLCSFAYNRASNQSQLLEIIGSGRVV